jgi:hypothetical protein
MCQLPELAYPLEWCFQIIAAASPEALPELISVLLAQGFRQTPTAGNVSKTGKYQTYVLNVTFTDHLARVSLTTALTQAKCVKYLL